MAVTIDQLAAAIRSADAAANDPSNPNAAEARLDASKMVAQLRVMRATKATTTSPLSDAVDPESNSYIAEQAKLGLTGDFLYNALSAISDPLANLVFGVEAPTTLQDKQGYQQAVEDAKKRMTGRVFDYTNVAPSGLLEKYAGIGARAVAGDPIMSMLGARGVGTAALEAGSSAIAASTGAFVGDITRDSAKELGMGESWQNFFGQVAGLLTGVAAGSTSAVARTAVGTVGTFLDARKANKNAMDTIDKTSDFIASSQLKEVIADAVKADPDIGATIQAAKALQEAVPGLKLTPGSVLADNPIIRKNLEVLLKDSPSFRADFTVSLRDGINAVDKRRKALFGEFSESKIASAMTARRGEYGVKLGNAIKRREGINLAIEKTLDAARTTGDAQSVGVAAGNLIDAREATARTEITAEYNRLFDKYEAEGVVFPKESVAALYGKVDTLLKSRIFTPFPTLVNKMNTLLAPTIAKDAATRPTMQQLLSGERLPTDIAGVQFRELSLEQLDSLKQEVNKSLRSAHKNVTNVVPALTVLKDTLDSEIAAIPRFGAAYKAVDTSYYAKIGVPMNTAGVRQLDSLNFREQVGRALSRPEQARDFLNLAGDAGVPVVKDAILLRLGAKAFNTSGDFRPDQYMAFLQANRGLIATVPGLAADLRDVGKTVKAYQSRVATLDMEYAKYAEESTNHLFSSVYKKGLPTVISEILTSPAKSERYLNSIRNFSPESAHMARLGVRASLLNNAFAAKDSRLFIKDNAHTFNAWFGPTYAKSVDSLVEVNSILGKVDPSALSFAFSFKEVDPLQRAFGTSLPQAGSLFRDRISSAQQKASIIFSRWFSKKTGAKRDEEMASLLLNPAALDRILKTTDAYKTNRVTLEKYLNQLSFTLNTSLISKMELAQDGEELAAQQAIK